MKHINGMSPIPSLKGMKTPDHDFLDEIHSLGSPALPSQVCTFVPISSCAFLHLSRPGILSCTDKNPGTAAPG